MKFSIFSLIITSTIFAFVSNIFISTKEAYSFITAKESLTNLLEVSSNPVGSWKELITNDFEEPVFQKYPELQKIKNNFYKNGAIYSSMTGSGSVIYGIFKR